MKFFLAALAATWLSIAPLPARALDVAAVDWRTWRALAVQDGGRRKPLDTLAWETFRTLANRTGFEDPQTGQPLDAVALYLTLIFDRPATAQDPAAPAGGSVAPVADKWDKAPLVRIDYGPLRQALNLSADAKYFSPDTLLRATLRDPESGRATAFVDWVRAVSRKPQKTLSTLESRGLELAVNLQSYQELREGRALCVVPLPGSEDERWLSVADLRSAEFSDRNDPGSRLRQIQSLWRAVETKHRSGSAESFHQASAEFLDAVRRLGPELGSYPSARVIALEVAYNHWVPFRYAWALTLVAFLAGLVSMGAPWRGFYAAAIAAFALACVAMLVGFAMRLGISGRAPVTSMYESVIYVGLGVALLGLLFELLNRRKFVLVAAAAVATLTLILADNSPAMLDPGIRPLQPVLRNNFWLVTHVMSITLSYAAFALALGISDITLGYFLARLRNAEAIAALSAFTYRTLQIGVALLAVGTILGGVWADYSWGRFWGWDPKEVWALVALLGYLAVLHARYAGWVGDLGLAALSVFCFSLVVMAWYGVNYVLGAGLHSYGFGGGGKEYVLAVLALQGVYVVVALLRARRDRNP